MARMAEVLAAAHARGLLRGRIRLLAGDTDGEEYI